MITLNPPVTETHDGITVLREDLCNDALPSGKVRGLYPWFVQLRESGVRGVVNHAVSYSNSHAIVGFCARAAGLKAVSFVNAKYPTPQTELAASFGTDLRFTGPMQLGPCRAHAARFREPGYLHLPWALIDRRPYVFIRDTIGKVISSPCDCDRRWAMVVPVGGGGYAWAVWDAVRTVFLGSPRFTVVGVPSSGDRRTNLRRIAALNPAHGVTVVDRTVQRETPFPSDPNYEHWAWPEALRLRDQGHQVMFFSVGRPLVKEDEGENRPVRPHGLRRP